MDARHLPKAIQWYEGMLLSPQHFQRLSLRHEEVAQYCLTTALPFGWGIRKLEIDKSLLTEGIYRISELEALMPDGTIIWHLADSSENDLSVDLNLHRDRIRQENLMIYLAVPAKRMSASKGNIERYSAEDEMIPDENTGESELSVPCMTPRIFLLTTQEPPQKYSSFPIAQFAYRNEHITLTEFSPPRLFVSPDSDIGRMGMKIIKEIREKARFLSDQVSDPSSIVRGAVLFETRFLIHSMTAELPRFEALLNTGLTHPYPLYSSLCALAGHVAALSSGQMPPIFPVYHHDDIYPAFKDTSDFIMKMLENIHQTYTPVYFEFEDDKFSLKLDANWVADAKQILVGIRGKSGMSEGYIEEWIRACIIGSEARIENIIAKRVLGAKREKLQNVQDIMPTRGVMLFSLTTDEYILPDQILQIFNPSEKERKKIPSEIILYVKNT